MCVCVCVCVRVLARAHVHVYVCIYIHFGGLSFISIKQKLFFTNKKNKTNKIFFWNFE